MDRLFRIVIHCVVIVSVAGATLAQDKSDSPRATITAFASTDRVRFTAPSSVVQMHLEVYSESAFKLFDFELKGGNVLDWHLQNGQAERVAAGAYLCIITVKNLAGKITQKIGIVSIVDQQVTVESVQSAELKPQQAQAIGPLEADASLTVLKASEAVNGIVLAHNGDEAQISHSQGPLTFRIGDFFSGKDQEQMRLTADGKLGLGVTDPQAKLEVAGTIRTSEGIVFPDGTIQTTAYVASGRSLSERVGLQRDAQSRSVIEQDKSGSVQQMLRLAPTATPDRLAKFAADGTTPVDTQLSESNGALLVGNAGATGNIQIFGPANADVFSGMGPDVDNGPAFNYGYAGSSFGRSAGFFNVRPDASAVAPNPSLRFLTANQQRMIITSTGNVGIGTTNPGTNLDVRGPRMRLQTDTGPNGPYLLLEHKGEPGFGRSYAIGSAGGVNGGGIGNFEIYDSTASATRLVITPSGGVGIGTNVVDAKLRVVGSNNVAIRSDGGIYTAIIGLSEYIGVHGVVTGNSGDSNGVSGYAFNGTGVHGYSENQAGVRGYSENDVGIEARSTNGVLVAGFPSLNQGIRTFHIERNGTYVTGSDFAESLPVRGDKASYEPGDLLVVSERAAGVVEKSRRPYDVHVAGVYSTRPGVLGADKDGATRIDPGEVPVAIVGIVPTKASTENGTIRVGDLLTTSRTPGHAMRCRNRQKCVGAVVGKAMEPLAQGKGVIKVLVTLR